MTNERDWKKGDVALVNGVRSLYKDGGSWEHGDERAFPWHHHSGLDIRPLVVIDPVDREQVERVRQVFRDRDLLPGDRVEDFQAALHEFANPTPLKPEEPAGLGAVVEDTEGRKWIRVDWTNPWCLARPNRRDSSTSPLTHGSHVLWDRLDAVKVLSEGVPA